jgi:hypothetical protein
VPDNSENIRRIASFLWEVAQDLHGAVAKPSAINAAPSKGPRTKYSANSPRGRKPDTSRYFPSTAFGYEINFNRHFYTYQPPRPVAAIDSDIRKVEKNILAMLKEVMG